MTRYLWPLGIFLLLVGFLAAGLRLDPREVPSPLVGRPAPAITMAAPDGSGRSVSTEDLRGQVWVLKVWASWCAACRIEHPVLLDLARAGAVPVYGLNYKDRPDDAQRWLTRSGNPYLATITDLDGRIGLDYGVYGVPETYVIDRNGIVRDKLTGPLTAELVRDRLLPLVRTLGG